MKPRDTSTRFWSKVKKTDGCWIWQGAIGKRCGYGMTNIIRNGKWSRTVAHRVAYELLVGEIPKGLHIDHLCRNRACVRPDHLEPVTRKTNLLRGEGPTGTKARQTHCTHGHPLSGDNLYIKANGCRECKSCNKIRDDKKNAARKLKRKNP